MEKIRVTLSRRIGPFPLGIWIVIVVVGVSLGLLLRRRFGVPGDEDTSGLAEPAFDDSALPGATGPISSGPVSGGTTPGFAPITVTQVKEVPVVDRNVLLDLIEEVERITKIGVDKPVITPRPIPPFRPAPKPAKPKQKPVDALRTFRSAVIGAYKAEGVSPPSNQDRINRIAAELRDRSRTVASLRRDIRTNERRAGRPTVAASRKYWNGRINPS